MPVKVKRGLGLLVVAVLAFIALNVTVRIGDGTESDLVSWPMFVLSLVVALGMLGSAIFGLILVAWGLLRD